MLKSKRANVLVAILAAVCMWGYVTGIVDPTVTKKVVGVPITVINEDSLLQEGLAVESIDITSVDLVVEGSRADISKVDMDDITVNADLYGRNKGINSIRLDVELPKGIKVESSTVDKIQVAIDQMISQDFQVQVGINGALSENTVLGKHVISPKYVKVYGTAANLQKIARVDAMVGAENLSEQMSVHQAQLKIKDANGREIPFVKAAVNTVEVSASINKTKEATLKVKTSGEVPEGYHLEEIKVNEKITLNGPESKLQDINTVYTEEIDLSEINKTEKMKVDVVLPEGVYTSDGTNQVEVEFILKKSESKELIYSEDEITVENLDEGLVAVVKTKVTANIAAPVDVLERITKSNTHIVLDLSGLKEGTHNVTANIKTDVEGVTEKVLDKEIVEVEIKKGN